MENTEIEKVVTDLRNRIDDVVSLIEDEIEPRISGLNDMVDQLAKEIVTIDAILETTETEIEDEQL